MQSLPVMKERMPDLNHAMMKERMPDLSLAMMKKKSRVDEVVG